MDIDEIRNLTKSSGQSILDSILSSILTQIDEAHKSGLRRGRFMDDDMKFDDEEFMESGWWDIEDQFNKRMTEEGIEIEDINHDGVEVIWFDDSKRFLQEFNKFFESELASWSTFIEDLIREAATDGKNELFWEGEIYENLDFQKALKKKFTDSGFRFYGLEPPGLDLHTGRPPERDIGLTVEQFVEINIQW